ncbi:MAG TPA: hypothetical protein VKT77_04660 [Chthonomonadaceae bacterium]|nr:hypothetical protein [Chthonomonadaceae bacterium]
MQFAKFGLVGAAVVLGACIAGTALAQDNGQPPAGARRGGQGRGGFGQFGRGGGQLMLVNLPADMLTKELKLSDDQKSSFEKVQTKFRADQQALRPQPGSPPDPDARQKMVDLSTAAQKDVDAILNTDQKTTATALVKDLTSLNSVGIPWQTYSDLKLTGEQKTKIAAISADVMKERQQKMADLQAARQAGDNQKAQEIMQSMFGNGQPNEKALAVLTADQKDLVTKYVKEHPQRPFGPGGGRRPANPPAF